ncbi:unnamed protein product, partial [marine sediment metagenome]
MRFLSRSQVQHYMRSTAGAVIRPTASAFFDTLKVGLMPTERIAISPITDVGLGLESQGTDTPYTPDSGV